MYFIYFNKFLWNYKEVLQHFKVAILQPNGTLRAAREIHIITAAVNCE